MTEQANPTDDAVPDTLAIDGLDVSYHDRTVLSGLSLRVKPGEIFGLLGSNGAGKTTLIRTICGRVSPRAGEVTVMGESIGSRATLGRIGLVPQDIALYLHLTVLENLEVFARLSGVPRSDVRAAVEWAVDVAHLGPRIDDRVEILSGGWKRRVNIAAAILHDPALLILDEPTVGVDIDARDELHELIRELSRGGMAMLLATHDMDQAEALCSRVGFLRQGRLDPVGMPDTLIAENFSGQRTLTVSVRGRLTPRQRAVMVDSGFAPDGTEGTWSVFGIFTDEGVARLQTGLTKLGIDVREVRQRAPGLDTLFADLARSVPGEIDTQ